MSLRPPLRVSAGAVRRFLVRTLDLTTEHPYAPSPRASTGRVLKEIRRLECVQIDPVAAVERNQHLVLAARVPGYAPDTLQRLLAEGRIFEYWANEGCVIPIDDYWMFEGVRRHRRQRLRHELALLRKPTREVLRALERSGPMPSRAFISTDRISGWWDTTGPKTKATTHALNLFCHTGEVIVVRREGIERYFDLAARALPNEHKRAGQVDTQEADRALLDKYLRAYRIFEPGDGHFGWRRVPVADRKKGIERLLRAGEILPLQVEGIRRAYYVLAADRDRLAKIESGKDGVQVDDEQIRFLAPLDNLLWRRQRLVDFFGFTYTWEIYTPVHKRRFGYYTMPILAGERLIGRIEPRLDRQGGRMVIRFVYLEPDVRPTRRLQDGLRRALQAFAGFHGVQEVVIEQSKSRLRI